MTRQNVLEKDSLKAFRLPIVKLVFVKPEAMVSTNCCRLVKTLTEFVRVI